MTISEALLSTGIPCCHPPYFGNSETYITYQLLGQAAMLYANGSEAETAVSYAVSIFADNFDASRLKEVISALECAGYIVTVEMESYDNEHRKNQISLIATIEGAQYG